MESPLVARGPPPAGGLCAGSGVRARRVQPAMTSSEGGQGERVAVVTGAAAGIGRATALLLASRGTHVIACDSDEAPLLRLEERVSGLTAWPLDVRRRSQ